MVQQQSGTTKQAQRVHDTHGNGQGRLKFTPALQQNSMRAEVLNMDLVTVSIRKLVPLRLVVMAVYRGFCFGGRVAVGGDTHRFAPLKTRRRLPPQGGGGGGTPSARRCPWSCTAKRAAVRRGGKPVGVVFAYGRGVVRGFGVAPPEKEQGVRKNGLLTETMRFCS